MRKLIIQQYITLDGFACGENDELDFMEKQGAMKTLEQSQVEIMKSVDLIILGRKTYELFAAYWPTDNANEQPMKTPINATPWLVFSKTISTGTSPLHSTIRFSSEDPVEEIRKLKSKAGKDLILWGSLSVTRLLLEKQCVDELHIIVYPFAIGKGRRFFPEQGLPEQAKLFKVETFEGAVLLRYVI